MKTSCLLFSIFTTLVICFATSFLLHAQPPQGISYQAVIRSAAGSTVSSQNVRLRLSIRDTTAAGTVVYQETHQATTNQQGLVNLIIGQGTVVLGTFASINWGAANKFLQVEADPTGGTSYTNIGTQQMMSVPYALYALNATTTLGGNNTIRLGFSSSTTWVCPAGVTQITVELWGAGGGGVYCSQNLTLYAGPSGGTGGYNRATLQVTPGQSYAIQIGIGGGRDVNSNGVAGGLTTFDNLLSAQAGGGARSGGCGGTGAATAGTNGARTNWPYGWNIPVTRNYVPVTLYSNSTTSTPTFAAGGTCNSGCINGQDGFAIVSY
jgi:hypothetical protein